LCWRCSRCYLLHPLTDWRLMNIIKLCGLQGTTGFLTFNDEKSCLWCAQLEVLNSE
jgi:hypothetical protein